MNEKELFKRAEELLYNYKKLCVLVTDDELDVEQRKKYARQIKKINNSLSILKERERKMVELRYFEKVTNKKIAGMFNLSEDHFGKIKKATIKEIIPVMFPSLFMG